MSKNDDRLHAFDAIRAWALILGIVLHGTLSFADGVDDQLCGLFTMVKQSAAGSTAFLPDPYFQDAALLLRRRLLFGGAVGERLGVLAQPRTRHRDSIGRRMGYLWLALVVIVAYALARRKTAACRQRCRRKFVRRVSASCICGFCTFCSGCMWGLSLAKRVDAWARGDRQGASRLSDPFAGGGN